MRKKHTGGAQGDVGFSDTRSDESIMREKREREDEEKANIATKSKLDTFFKELKKDNEETSKYFLNFINTELFKENEIRDGLEKIKTISKINKQNLNSVDESLLFRIQKYLFRNINDSEKIKLFLNAYIEKIKPIFDYILEIKKKLIEFRESNENDTNSTNKLLIEYFINYILKNLLEIANDILNITQSNFLQQYTNDTYEDIFKKISKLKDNILIVSDENLFKSLITFTRHNLQILIQFRGELNLYDIYERNFIELNKFLEDIYLNKIIISKKIKNSGNIVDFLKNKLSNIKNEFAKMKSITASIGRIILNNLIKPVQKAVSTNKIGGKSKSKQIIKTKERVVVRYENVKYKRNVLIKNNKRYVKINKRLVSI